MPYYHLVIPGIISILILSVIILNRKKLYSNKKQKWFWISITLFLVIYFLILAGSIYADISANLNLQKFDLDKDGSFSLEEQTVEQQKAMKESIADVGRNFAFITGLIFSGIISLFVFICGKSIEYFREKRVK